ncbi:MAG: polysaccharide deacetylase family protein [Candidatus Sigynarchaeum springense]
MTSNVGIKNAKTKAWVTNWPDERSSALSLTFDDGYASHHAYLYPVLKEFGLKATFFVVPGWLDDPSTSKYASRIGTWREFEQMAGDGFEIGSHGMTHVKLTRLMQGAENRAGTLLHELAESKRVIERHIPTQPCSAIAYPYSLHNRTVSHHAARYYIAARGIGNPFILVTGAIIDLMERRSEKGWRGNRPVSCFNRWYLTRRNEIIQRQQAFFQKQGRVLKSTLLERFASNIETRAFGRGVWSVFVQHEVIPFDETRKVDTFSPYPIEWFKPFAKWLAEQVKIRAVWVDTVSNVMKYLKERDTFNYRVLREGKDRIELEIHHGLDASTYNYPLTIDVLVPDTWKHVDIVAEERHERLECKETWKYDGATYVRFNAIPTGQTLILDGS